MRMRSGRICSTAHAGNFNFWLLAEGSRQLMDGLSILYEEKKLCIIIIEALYR